MGRGAGIKLSFLEDPFSGYAPPSRTWRLRIYVDPAKPVDPVELQSLMDSAIGSGYAPVLIQRPKRRRSSPVTKRRRSSPSRTKKESV